MRTLWMNLTYRRLCWSVLFLAGLFPIQPAQAQSEADARSTAVALNYCRAAFHRIRTNPTKHVLIEEREQILNNLNLNGVADEEVIDLYASVLREIGEIEIAEQERIAIDARYRTALTQRVALTAFQLGTEVTTAQHMAAIRTGAQSWWDVRNINSTHEYDSWKVERARMQAVVERSSEFMETFWKLAQKREISDRWLLRDTDLERLQTALAEADPKVRLRVLLRMEPFMTCYPPWWYYVGRTHQELGQIREAEERYAALIALGEGHFRKDEMLAAAAANQAIILAYLSQDGADVAARKALAFAPDAWQVNLVSALVLERHGKVKLAEDALLRNLDSDLEESQSLRSLVNLYCNASRRDELIAALSHAETVAKLPAWTLVRAAAVIGERDVPAPLVGHLLATTQIQADQTFGRDDVLIRMTPDWQPQEMRLSLQVGDTIFTRKTIHTDGGVVTIRFQKAGTARPEQADRAGVVTLTMRPEQGTPIQLQFRQSPPGAGQQWSRVVAIWPSRNQWHLAAIKHGPTEVSFVAR